MPLHLYLPQDRLRALARGETLPDRTSGAALFADISGFTALTEGLRESLGARQGAEELSKQLGAVYSALIAEVEKFGGSVIGFAGDSMLSWFDHAEIREQRIGDEQSSACALAVACGLSLQRVIQLQDKLILPDKSTIALALKVTIASGAARRFVVGDPDVQRIDVLAGATVTRTAVAEHLAQKGELVIDETTASSLRDVLTIKDWCSDSDSGERFAVVAALTKPVEPPIISSLDVEYLDSEELRPWLHGLLFEREQMGQGSFLTEFRPCVTLFIRFTGIDFDSDEAGSQLNTFVQEAQQTAARHGGTLMDLTIGDKGSYIYVNFGALSAHEDDAGRAVSTALELREAAQKLGFLRPLQIGITQGTLCVGAYGGQTRKTFAALGDEVNLAARLMTTAAVGEILVSSHVYKAVERYFVFEPRPPLPLKGKAEPLPVFALTSERKQRAIRLQEPTYALPMVGRTNELKIIEEKLDLILSGKAQVIGIVAEAGMGKSRLVAEAIRLAHKKGFVGYGGACQSDGINTPYLAWKSIWSAFFDVDPAAPLKKQMRLLEGELEDRAPHRLQAMPLLSVVLDMTMPENDFTSNLEPQHRMSALTALFEDCLQVASKEEPLLIVIEDVHWIDALSHDLLEDLAIRLADSSICFVLAYRPPQITRLQAPRLEALPQFTKIELHELTRAEAEQAIRAKLAQLYPARSGAVPPPLVDRLMGRAQGNPFYLEELLNYLRDRGLDPRDPADLERIELPDSLHTLVLSRIDQLSEHEKTTLRVASIVGRLFRAAWLTGYYPALGDLARVKIDLDKLDRMDITPLDSEPELAYLFKHIVTHEVSYESLPFGIRVQLHEQLAKYLEGIAAPVDTIAHHYGQSINQAKQREYWQKAGASAQDVFANDSALDYFAKLLPLLTDPHEQIDLRLQRGDILLLIGQWADAEVDYQTALTLTEQSQNALARVRCQKALGKLAYYQGNFFAARQWAEEALAGAEALGDPILQAHCVSDLAVVGLMLGDEALKARARARLEMALPLARDHGDLKTVAHVLGMLAIYAKKRSDYDLARSLLEEALALSRQLGDKPLLAEILDTYAIFIHGQGEYSAAQVAYTELLALAREMGDKQVEAVTYINAGSLAISQGLLAHGRSLFEQALPISRATNFKGQIIYISNNLAETYFQQGDYTTAQRLAEEAAALAREISFKEAIGFTSDALGMFALATHHLTDAQAHFSEALKIYQELDDRTDNSRLYGMRAMLAVLQGQAAEAQQLGAQALAEMRQSNNPVMIAYSLCNLGFVAFHQQEYAQAQAHYLKAITLQWPSEYRGFDWADAWAGLARACMRQPEKIERGVQLAAVAEQILHNMGAVLFPILRAPFDEALAFAKESLGEAGFQSAWEAGATLSLAEAVHLMLDNGE